MTKILKTQQFEESPIRQVWNSEKEQYYFSIIDIMAVLTESKDPAAYWRKLKQRLKEEGNETVTNCHGLKMLEADGWTQIRMRGDHRIFGKKDNWY